jgi:hypothetical protein
MVLYGCRPAPLKKRARIAGFYRVVGKSGVKIISFYKVV